MKNSQEAFLAQVAESCRGIVERAFAGTASPREAIKAKCLDCSNFDRDEITHCAVVLCPLHAYRPYQPNAPKLRQYSGVHGFRKSIPSADVRQDDGAANATDRPS